MDIINKYEIYWGASSMIVAPCEASWDFSSFHSQGLEIFRRHYVRTGQRLKAARLRNIMDSRIKRIGAWFHNEQDSARLENFLVGNDVRHTKTINPHRAKEKGYVMIHFKRDELLKIIGRRKYNRLNGSWAEEMAVTLNGIRCRDIHTSEYDWHGVTHLKF